MLNKLLSSLISLFLCINQSCAIIFIDVSVIRNNRQDLVRFVQFDTLKQSFKKIDYYQIDDGYSAEYTSEGGADIEFSRNGRHYAIDIKHIDFETHALKINTDLGIRIEDVTNTNAIEKKCEEWRSFLLFENIPEIKTGKSIVKNILKKGKAYSNFRIYRHTQNKDRFKQITKSFSNIFEDQTDNNTERGVLGELATYLTMLSFQYIYHDAKMEHNHGFDGVYIDESNNPEVFITESKCRTESKSAKKYLEEQLSMNAIYEMLTKMSKKKDSKSLSKTIKESIQKNSTYAMAHRIHDNGIASCAFQKLSYVDWLTIELLNTRHDDAGFIGILGKIAHIKGYEVKKKK